jgi:NAD(P)-dependent dehydrogenase (short-subunit alcohol dehydrogenase family)
MELRGRNALVTGGAQRVGAAIVRALACAGANVFIHYNSSGDAAHKLAAEIREAGVAAHAGPADLSDPTCTPELIATATKTLGAVSLLVNSASSFPRDTLADLTIGRLRETIDVSLTAPIFLTQAFAAALPSDTRGAVVNLSDSRTTSPYRQHFAYTIAKGGLDTFTRAAATALGPQIRVNAVALGVVLPPAGHDDNYVNQLAAALPLAAPGGAEPVAHAVQALLENDFITGEIVRIDGGGHLTTATAAPDA